MIDIDTHPLNYYNQPIKIVFYQYTNQQKEQCKGMSTKRSFHFILFTAMTIAAICVVLSRPLHVAHAQSTPASTQVGSITGLGTCWSSDCYIISTSAPYVDNGCGGGASAQYATSPGAPGNTTIHATLLGAFLAGKKVSLEVQNCVFGHPQIIGIGVAP